MLKIGIIGVGHLGKIHLNRLKEISALELTGFYDHNEEHARKAAEESGVKKFDSIDELIEKVDIVDIVTPTLSHYEIAVKALLKSKHLFIEKPVTNSLKEANELIGIAQKANVKVQVGHVERFNPAFIAAKPYCSEPMFIETHRLAQFNPRGTDVSVVLDLMIHDIDIVLSLVKSDIKQINASGVAVVSETPDIANARIEFGNGCVANLTASRISLKDMRKSRFFRRDAYITVDFLKKEVNVIRLKNIIKGEKTDPLAITIDLENGKGSKLICFETPEVEQSNAIKTEFEMFAGAIYDNTAPPVTLEDGYKALDVACRIIDSIKFTPFA